MKAVLGLELIGDDCYQLFRLLRRGAPVRYHKERELRAMQFGQPHLRPWVARITGWTERGPVRAFCRANTTDYRHANSTGSRGIMAYYVLSDGIYEVNERTSWKHSRRYFLRAQNGVTTEISRQDAERLCAAPSASPS